MQTVRTQRLLLIIIVIISRFSSAAKSIEGTYFNTIKEGLTFQLKIKKINDTLIYYELTETNFKDKFFGENKSMGVAYCSKNDKLNILYSSWFSENFKIEFKEKQIAFIDVSMIKFNPTFYNFGGKYIKTGKSEILKPSYSLFYRENYYYEYRTKNSYVLNIYDYPVISNNKRAIKLAKDSEVRMLTYVYDCKTKEEGLYYVKIQNKGKWINGWITGENLQKNHFLWKYQNGYKDIR